MLRFCFGIVFMCTLVGFGQRYGKNLPGFQYRNWHFGTMLGTNTTSYSIKLKPDSYMHDSITNIKIVKGPGFAIHIPVVSFNAHETFHFRFIPSISFHESLFQYTHIHKGRFEQVDTRVEPTNLNFPLLIKINTKRINNFSAYALGGAGYSLDLASQKDVEQSILEPIIKLKQHDFTYHVGGGFDFYLPYFKLGFEIKTTGGINNLLIQDNTFFAAPIESLKSRMWWFSITFEG